MQKGNSFIKRTNVAGCELIDIVRDMSNDVYNGDAREWVRINRDLQRKIQNLMTEIKQQVEESMEYKTAKNKHEEA